MAADHNDVKERERERELEDIDKEMTNLEKYMMDNKIAETDYDSVVNLFRNTLKNLESKQKWTSLKKNMFRSIFFIIALILALQISSFQKLCAIVWRLILLQVLPWWDWTQIYHSDCILTNPFYVRRNLMLEEDCQVCDSLSSVERVHNISPRIWDDLMHKERPFVVLDAMAEWPVMKTDNFWFENLTEIYMSSSHDNVEACDLATNLGVANNDLRQFLSRVYDPDVQHWFGHWENCDKKASKALRPLYRRPYFMPSAVDLSESNWVLMSSDYDDNHYKKLEVWTKLVWLAQFRGWTRLRLQPRAPCHRICRALFSDLQEGQIVVLSDSLWQLEYLPGQGTDNLAIAVGGDWN